MNNEPKPQPQESELANLETRISSYAKDGSGVAIATNSEGVVMAQRANGVEKLNAVLAFTSDEWRAFLLGVRNNEFDV